MNPSKKVFLVDDDEDDQVFFTEALSEIKNAILFDIANNGKEALDKLQNHTALPDLIFMDINMPVMGGIECLAALKEKPQIKHIPVVILSSNTDEAHHARKFGAKAFIKKPSSGVTLRLKLEEMIHLDFTVDNEIANRTFHSQAFSLLIF